MLPACRRFCIEREKITSPCDSFPYFLRLDRQLKAASQGVSGLAAIVLVDRRTWAPQTYLSPCLCNLSAALHQTT